MYREGTVGTVMSLISDTRASLNVQRGKLEEAREGGDHDAPDLQERQRKPSSQGFPCGQHSHEGNCGGRVRCNEPRA